MEFIAAPLGWILRQFSNLFGGNFALAVFAFTLLINVIMIPLSIKSQKSSMGQLRIKPKMDALKQKYGDDKQKYSEEVQKLYSQENISMSGGCLPMIIRLLVMFGVYQAVLSPLKYILRVSAESIAAAKTATEAVVGKAINGYYELQILQHVKDGSVVSEEITSKLNDVNFSFLGIDLTTTPDFSVNIFKDAQLNWIIPVLAFAAAMLSSIISMKIQKKTNPDAPNMKGMMITMPFISLIIGFTVSCAAGFYWACSSLISGLIQAFVQTFYGPQKMIAEEQTKELFKRHKDEKQIISKTNN